VDVATYRECRYDGGFEGMKASPKATLKVASDRVELRRPRTFFGSRKTNIMRIWAKWSAVVDLDIRKARDGTRVMLTTKARGTARIIVPGIDPLEVWRALDQTDVRPRIPPRVRRALDGEADLVDAPEDEESEGEALEAGTDEAETDEAETDEADEDGADDTDEDRDNDESDVIAGKGSGAGELGEAAENDAPATTDESRSETSTHEVEDQPEG
jgi:hypothetical protein